MLFRNRVEAGKKLALALIKYRNKKDGLILALPRGGVVIGAQVAKILNLPLDLLFVKKIGHPNNSEYALGAVSEAGFKAFNQEGISLVNNAWLNNEIKKELDLIKQQREKYLKGRRSLSLENKTLILVDDGIATGYTMEAAILEAKSQNPKKIIIAVPIMPKDNFEKFKNLVGEVITLEIPEDFFGSVGNYYKYFPQISDKKVINLL